jgi:predicted secreted protein
MTDAILGLGILYAIDDGTTGLVFQTMGEVFEVVPPNQQTDEVEATHYASTGGYREFIGGLKDGGEVTFSINWIPGNPTDVILRNLHASSAVRDHRITFPNGATMKFPGWIRGFERATPLDDRMTATITVRVAGDTTYTDPAS